MVKQVWKSRGLPADGIDKAVTSLFANKFWGGVQEGYGALIESLEYSTPDYDMLIALKQNVWHFGAAKNYTMLKDIGRELIDPDGKLRSWPAFKKATESIVGNYSKQWLETEYNTAVSSGQMCSKWVGIQENKDVLPILEFDAVIDGHTTDLCRSLHETRLRADHPFWSKYYPPNHFNERSTVRQLASGKITPDDAIPSADLPTLFDGNLAATKLAFPNGHPYYIDNPADLKQKAITIMNNGGK